MDDRRVEDFSRVRASGVERSDGNGLHVGETVPSFEVQAEKVFLLQAADMADLFVHVCWPSQAWPRGFRGCRVDSPADFEHSAEPVRSRLADPSVLRPDGLRQLCEPRKSVTSNQRLRSGGRADNECQ